MLMQDRRRESRETRRTAAPRPTRINPFFAQAAAPRQAGVSQQAAPAWTWNISMFPTTSTPLAPAPAEEQPGTVLVIDADPATRAHLRALLTARGWKVYETADPRLALEIYGELRPDAVILDDSPIAGGVSTLRALRRLDPRARVVMCALEPDRNLVGEAFAAGALDFLAKPVREGRLFAALAKAN